MNTLHPAQLDALELACLDCSYTPCEDSTPKAALKDIAKNPLALIVTDLTGLLDMLRTHGFAPNSQVILCSQGPSALSEHDAACFSQVLPQLRYLIGATVPGFMRSVFSSILEFQITRGKGFRGIASRLIKVEQLKIRKRCVKSSTEREELQEIVNSFFSEGLADPQYDIVNGTSSYPKNLADVLDEFLMNAIWDANPERDGIDRKKVLQLKDSEHVDVEFGFDGVNLFLSVEDRYGTFPQSAMRGPFRFAMGIKDETKINEGPGGAGLGLYMILQKVAALSIEVNRGASTRAVAVLRADLSLRDMQKKPRTVLLFDT